MSNRPLRQPWHRATVRATRRPALRWLPVLVLALLAPTGGAAFEALDGAVRLHGFYETQLRGIGADYVEDWDLVQWWHILNLELEMDLLEEPWGPVDMVTGFVRAEVRYDCVYSRACGLFRNVNTFGDRAERLPRRLSNAVDVDGAGTIPLPEEGGLDYAEAPRRPRPVSELPGFRFLFERSLGADDLAGNPGTSAECLALYGPAACSTLAGGSSSPVAVDDDPLPVLFDRFGDFRFTAIRQRGGAQFGRALLPLGPWLPENFVEPVASMADVPNPLDDTNTSPKLAANYFNGELINNTLNPAIKQNPGFLGDVPPSAFAGAAARLSDDIPDLRFGGALPFRPIPVADEGDAGVARPEARGIFLPSEPVRRALRDDALESFFPFNFREAERAWNRGQSQQQTKELKEAYLDVELFDARWWLRIGRQTIVWGKTELFSPSDQFNPQDLALASLPTLEESRIPLWAVRSTHYFYGVGPLQDVRLELAAIVDDFQPADLGACGEAYTVDQICAATFGAFTHGFTGVGVLGVEHPPAAWESLEGWQVGGRLEFRWGRFSFTLSDFYGFEDFPYPERVVTFERNVDPVSGLPRRIGARGPCRSIDRSEPACLRAGPTRREGPGADADLADAPNNALDFHPANQQLFAFVCAATIGIAGSSNPSACGASAFNGRESFREQSFTSAQILSATLAGSARAQALGLFAVGDQLDLPRSQDFLAFEITPVVTLSQDPRDLDNAGSGCTDRRWFDNPNNQFADKQIATCGGTGFTTFDLQDPNDDPLSLGATGLAEVLTPEQEALVGCGPFYGINCDVSGIDWLNAEGSALVQSFPGIEGTGPGWRSDDAARPQPGTVGFQGGPRCTTGHIGGPLDPDVMLPGCRGPGDPGYDPLVDGDPAGVRTFLDLSSKGFQPSGVAGHPLTGQPWQNEMAALSWNFLVVTVIGSEEFDPRNAYVAGECGFVTPQICSSVQGLFNAVGVRRNDVRAGGSARFGRRDFQWHSGGVVTLAYAKRNVLGFAMDFAEDRTKTNWGVELTWVEDVPVLDNDERDGLSDVHEVNLVVSVDRPTFINFLNPNRSFFINSQWFLQYRTVHGDGVPANGPVNLLGTLTVQTGYWQDRLLPSLTFVYDVQSVSGAVLTQVEYRVNARFTIGVGANAFFGRQQLVDMPLNPVAPGQNRTGPDAYQDAVENGLSPIRDRDEVFVRARVTF